MCPFILFAFQICKTFHSKNASEAATDLLFSIVEIFIIIIFAYLPGAYYSLYFVPPGAGLVEHFAEFD